MRNLGLKAWTVHMEGNPFTPLHCTSKRAPPHIHLLSFINGVGVRVGVRVWDSLSSITVEGG